MKKITVEMTGSEAITLSGVLIFCICNKCNDKCDMCPLGAVNKNLMRAIEEMHDDEVEE